MPIDHQKWASMAEQDGAPSFDLYLDDSGTRCPFKPSRPTGGGMDWFALGGLLLKSEDLAAIESAHNSLCGRHGITSPLHSAKIRAKKKEFAWIGSDPARGSAFLQDLEETICTLPAHVIACVVHRPGYNARYDSEYGTKRWSLCKTAYRIAVERAAKIANEAGRRIVVHVERTGKTEDAMIRAYHSEMLTLESYFDPKTSHKYQPMSRESMERVLVKNPEFFTKQSLTGQFSDLVLYPVVRGGYQPNYSPFIALKKAGRLVDSLLQKSEIEFRGIKYSCFDGRERRERRHRREQ